MTEIFIGNIAHRFTISHRGFRAYWDGDSKELFVCDIRDEDPNNEFFRGLVPDFAKDIILAAKNRGYHADPAKFWR
jgi:hypothetical protein